MKKNMWSIIPALIIIFLAGYLFYSRRPLSPDETIKAETIKAAAMLQKVYERSKKQGLSLDTAKMIGAQKLRTRRYGPNKQNYFWADTKNGVNVVLYGRKDVEGKSRYNDNFNGIYYVREIIKSGLKPGGGYTDYYYPKMNQKKPLPKRSFSLYFAPFDWVIGTGYYLEDVKK